MAPYFHRPENALKRSEELIAVGQKVVALQQLHDVITNKRNRQWQPSAEKIMLKYVELCVDLRRGRMAKEGLHQYKNIAQNVSISSLELVVKRFLELAEEKVSSAQEKAEKIVLDIDDLEASETPESILMSFVTGEDTKDRTDREVVTPWLKFLWETYRIVLEVLRNNIKLEPLYQETAQQAFKFCLKYQRKTEFRRLCEILRTHLLNLTKYSYLPNAINLNTSAESLQMHLDTRFAQLNAAVELELWLEAFRSVDDLHGLMLMSKAKLKPASMADYYSKLTQMFLVAENYLFHAYAFKKFFNLQRVVNRNITPEERKQLASAVLLAALAIPVVSTTRGQYGYFGVEQQRERNLRLAALLMMNKAPTREMLLRELLSKDILDMVYPELRELHKILEVDFHPLLICEKLSPIVQFLSGNAQLAKYIAPIQEVTLTRLLQQLGRVYKTVKIDAIAKLATFSTPFEIEKFIMEACKRGDMHVRIDHQSQSVTFTDITLIGSREEVAGVQLQNAIKSQLSNLARRLHVIEQDILPGAATLAADARAALFQQFRLEAGKEHQAALQRKTIIEQKKEELETLMQRREQMEIRERMKLAQREAEQEKIRLAEESKRREAERIQREREEIEREQKLRLAEEMKRKSEAAGIKLDLEDLTGLDSEQLFAKQVEQLANEKREMMTRLNALAKRIDHLERAIRKEEYPLLEQDAVEQKQKDLEFYQQQQAQIQKQSREDYERNMAIRQRMLPLLEDAKEFKKATLAKRSAEFEQRRQVILQKVKDRQRRREEERLQREKEEAERREREQQENERAERERAEQEHLAREHEEQQRLQRERQEAEERQQREEAARAAAPAPAPAVGRYVPPNRRR